MYVDANEGSASGGHVALRLEDRTYHFGYHEPGSLRLDRDDSERFAHVYGTLENRNLQVLRVAVDDRAFRQIRSSFNRRYLEEAAEFAVLEELSRDIAFASAWSDGRATVQVRAGGYFAPPPDPPPSRSAIERLRRRVNARYGEGVLPEQRLHSQRAVAALIEAAAGPVTALQAPGAHPAAGYGLARRAEEARARGEALRILERGATLDGDAVHILSRNAFPLDAPTRATLAAFADRLEADLVDAVGSRRPDAGFVLLVGLARLLALEQTLARGRLVVLDVFPADAVRLSVEEIEAQGGRLRAMSAGLRAELSRVRAALNAEAAVRESDYAALEALAGRFHELERSRTTGADLRAAPGRLLPARAAWRSLDLEPPAGLDRHVDALRMRERELGARLDDDHHYNLLTHNCVSELFVQIEAAVGAGPGSVETLGGHVAPGRGLDFIPFVATDRVAETYRIDETEELPSYRLRRVRSMEEREGTVAVLRESNVLTSTAYEPNATDSAFLFFTEGTVIARPLLGLANLLYGVGTTAIGVPLAAFDEGRTLSAGFRGAVWSLPELAFFNVRKGSYFHVERMDGSGTAGVPTP